MSPQADTVDFTQPQYIAGVYNECAEEYAEAFHNQATVAVDLPRLERLVDLSGAAQGLALDVGCGSGMHYEFFAGKGFSWVGIDVASGMLAAGRCRGVTGLLTQADATALPVRTGAADVVVALESLVHMGINGLRRALAEIRRVLRPGGYALLGLQIGDGQRHVRYPLGPRRTLSLLLLDEVAFARECATLALEVVWSERRTALAGETDFEKLMAIVQMPP